MVGSLEVIHTANADQPFEVQASIALDNLVAILEEPL